MCADSGQQTGPTAFRYCAWAWTQKNSGCALSVTFDTSRKKGKWVQSTAWGQWLTSTVSAKSGLTHGAVFCCICFFSWFSHTAHMSHFLVWRECICHRLYSVFPSLPHADGCEWTDGKRSGWYRSMSHLGKKCQTRCWRKKNSVVAKCCQFSGTTTALNHRTFCFHI